VGVAGMEAPFHAEVRDGRLYGRGAMDTKGALAALMLAAAHASAGRLRGDVVLTAVVDEEYASIGTEAVVREYRADAAIVGEPSGLQVVTEHKGFVWFEIETAGVAAHGSLPEVGVDAIAAMGRVLVEREAAARRRAAGRRHPTLGTGSVHASLVSGGQELSSYPAACRLSLERRTLPGETAESAEAELRAALARIAGADPRFRATLRRTFARSPMEADRGSPIVAAVFSQVERLTGSPPVYAGMSGWLDSALLDEAGIPTVVLGPGGEGLHGAQEWVDLDSVRACRAIVCGVIDDFCA
jgi:acetylornithine deacetylase